jgi:hypothetical protein
LLYITILVCEGEGRLLHFIPSYADDICYGSVIGLTILGNELFLLREPNKRRIEVFSASEFKFQRVISLNELHNIGGSGLTSCAVNNCLYVSDWGSGAVLKIELTSDETVNFKVNGRPQGLSVNDRHNLIVTCQGLQDKVIECTTDGELVREILLNDDVIGPTHAVQVNSNQFLVSHGSYGSLHRLCLVDADGRVKLSYGSHCGSAVGQLAIPKHFVLDKSGSIFVGDQLNDRVVVLDNNLKWSRYLQIDGGVRSPTVLCLNERRSQLLIGEIGMQMRVLVISL